MRFESQNVIRKFEWVWTIIPWLSWYSNVMELSLMKKRKKIKEHEKLCLQSCKEVEGREQKVFQNFTSLLKWKMVKSEEDEQMKARAKHFMIPDGETWWFGKLNGLEFLYTKFKFISPVAPHFFEIK